MVNFGRTLQADIFLGPSISVMDWFVQREIFLPASAQSPISIASLSRSSLAMQESSLVQRASSNEEVKKLLDELQALKEKVKDRESMQDYCLPPHILELLSEVKRRYSEQSSIQRKTKSPKKKSRSNSEWNALNIEESRITEVLHELNSN